MSEKKMVGRNVAIALGIICILLMTGLGVAMAYYTMTIDNKDTKINQLNATITDQINTIASLDANITTLTNEKNQLQAWLDGNVTSDATQISLLNTQISSLNNQINQLQTSLNSLQTTYNNYLSDHSYTNEQYQSLSNQITTLQNQYAGLQSLFFSLEANYTTLLNEYQEALSKIPHDKGISIDSVDWNRGGPVNAGVTDVVVRNLGVNATTVVSLKLYWNYNGVLASSASVNVTISGNSTADISTFLPISGWNNYYDTWTLKVYTVEGYNATSDPLPLVSG